jgi:hypothetical protein
MRAAVDAATFLMQFTDHLAPTLVHCLGLAGENVTFGSPTTRQGDKERFAITAEVVK